MKISVFGRGHVGSVHAACITHVGHDVVAINVLDPYAEFLAHGRLPCHEPGSPEMLGASLGTGRLTFSTNPAQTKAGPVPFIYVRNQRRDANAADRTYVEAAFASALGVITPAHRS